MVLLPVSPKSNGLTAQSGADHWIFLCFIGCAIWLSRLVCFCSPNSCHRPADLVDTGDPSGTPAPGCLGIMSEPLIEADLIDSVEMALFPVSPKANGLTAESGADHWFFLCIIRGAIALSRFCAFVLRIPVTNRLV